MTRADIRTQVLICATDPETARWTNRQIAADLDVDISAVGKERARLTKGRGAKLHKGAPLRLTDLGLAYAQFRKWRVGVAA